MTAALHAPASLRTPRSFLNTPQGMRPAAGWYADPACAEDARWWDGTAWGAQSQTGTYAERAFQHSETLNEHVHDAIDTLWLAKLDRILRLAKGEIVAELPVRPTLPSAAPAVASMPTLSLVPGRPLVPAALPLVPSALPLVPAALPLSSAQLAQRIVAERGAGSTWQAIADRLNLDAVPTARGNARWRTPTVQSAGGHVRPPSRTRTARRPSVLAIA